MLFLENERKQLEYSTYLTNCVQQTMTLNHGNTSALLVPGKNTYFHNNMTKHNGSYLQCTIQIKRMMILVRMPKLLILVTYTDIRNMKPLKIVKRQKKKDLNLRLSSVTYGSYDAH